MFETASMKLEIVPKLFLCGFGREDEAEKLRQIVLRYAEGRQLPIISAELESGTASAKGEVARVEIIVNERSWCRPMSADRRRSPSWVSCATRPDYACTSRQESWTRFSARGLRCRKQRSLALMS